MLARRTLLKSALLGGAALATAGRPAAAQQAIESLRMFIPAAPGGGWDQTGRSMEQALRAAGMVRTFQFDNVAGAGGAVGLPRFVNGMRGQANTLMVAGLVMVGATITNRSPNNLTQVTPIAKLTEEAEIVVVPASSPHRTMQDLVTAFRANPGAVSWAGGSAGGTDHILAGLIAQALGIEPRRLSYVAFAGGGPATAAIIGNQVTAGVSGFGEFIEQVRAGRMRAIAISSEQRQAGFDVPTLKESGINVSLTNWRGVFAPPGVNDAAKAAMIDLMTRMNATPQWREICQQRDWTQSFIVGDAYKAFVESEIQRITGVLRDLGLAG
jgi:putative tricarboxylic transport membrane protein